MGIPKVTKNNLGPSQLDLGAFMTAGKKLRSETRSLSSKLEDLHTKQWDQICADLDNGSLEADCVDAPADAPLPFRASIPRSSPSVSIPAPSTTSPKGDIKDPPTAATSLMPPPPPRAPLHKVSTIPVARHEPDPSGDTSVSNIEPDWASFLDSNTQVAREISDLQVKLPLPVTPKKKTYDPPTNDFLTVPTDFLTDICTQDLQYSSSPSSTPTETVPDTRQAPEGETAAVSKSFGEFDDQEISSQDLRDLEV